MVIRLDTKRVKDIVNNTAEPIGVDGDPSTNVPHGVSEADKILEGARKSMASAGLADDADLVEKTNEEILQNMANADEEPGPEMTTTEAIGLPSVDILKPDNVPEETH
jgi:protein phosphatase PTC1